MSLTPALGPTALLLLCLALAGCGSSTPTPASANTSVPTQASQAEPENAVAAESPWRDVEAEIRRQQTIVGTECALYFGQGADSLNTPFTVSSGGATLTGAVTCDGWDSLPVPACGVVAEFREGVLIAAHMSNSADSLPVREMQADPGARPCFAVVALEGEVPAAGQTMAELEHAANVFNAMLIPVEGTVATEAIGPARGESTACPWQAAADGSIRSPEGESFAADVQRVVNFDDDGHEDIVVNTGQCGNWGDCMFALLRGCEGGGYEAVWGPEYAQDIVVMHDDPTSPIRLRGRTAAAGCDDPLETELLFVAGRWQQGVTCRTGDGIWGPECGERTPACAP